MDPRQPPQHPFSRNTAASPYGRFPPSSTSYPPSSHAPNAPSSYPDHQRRPSDPPYPSYGQRPYGGEGPTHSRHQSASSVGHGPVNRGMPPPSSPQQTAHSYGMPPRATPTGQPSNSGFSSGRELPALPPTRPGMSISDILGGPPPAREREREGPPHFGSPISNAGGQTSTLPRTSTAPDYSPAFRRPHTPEPQRM